MSKHATRNHRPLCHGPMGMRSYSDAAKISDLWRTFGFQSALVDAHLNQPANVRTRERVQKANESTKVNGSSILYLACWQRADELVSSLRQLFAHFNSKYRYPVIIFYDDKNGTERFDTKSLLKKLQFDKRDLRLISFEYLQFTFPPGISEDSVASGHIEVAENSFPGYNHMISFWAYNIFHHPVVRKLQYIVRLDTDSNIYQPVPMDLFAMMKESDYHYAFRFEVIDPEFVVKGMAKFVLDYVAERNIVPAQAKNFKLIQNAAAKLDGIPAYYNNFEIIHVPTFLRSDMEEFRKALYDSKHIYTHRWGDAPQRYAMVNIFLSAHKVHRIYESAYEHQGMRVPVNHFFEPDCDS